MANPIKQQRINTRCAYAYIEEFAGFSDQFNSYPFSFSFFFGFYIFSLSFSVFLAMRKMQCSNTADPIDVCAYPQAFIWAVRVNISHFITRTLYANINRTESHIEWSNYTASIRKKKVCKIRLSENKRWRGKTLGKPQMLNVGPDLTMKKIFYVNLRCMQDKSNAILNSSDAD